MKRTLKRELKVPEIAKREANGTSRIERDCWQIIVSAALLVANTNLYPQRYEAKQLRFFISGPVGIDCCEILAVG